jgi:FtsP/CotA-like multicopper oxidase with cupredoxin domain
MSPDPSTRYRSLGLSRRDFLRLTTISGGLALGGVACGRDPSGSLEPSRMMGGKPPAARNPLYIPPTVSPTGYVLNASPAVVPLGGGRTTSAWTYNGLLPGPTLKVQRGSPVAVTLVNGLSEPTITHWHGMVVDDLNDGHPRFAVAPGGSYAYQFTVDQRAALNWYHPHPHMLTGEQVCLGLAGAFVVTDTEEAALGLPTGSYEVPLVIRDASFDRAGNLKYVSKNGGFLGSTPLVNGTLNPRLAVGTALYRFRILNGANARIFGLALGTGGNFTLIGNDGGLLAQAVSLARIDVAPAERADLLIDFRGLPVGTRIMLRDLRAGWDLLEFEVTQSVSVPATVPTTLSTIVPLGAPALTRIFSFDGMSRINGLLYDVNRIDFQVPLGQTERWRFSTNGNAPHPVHVHGGSFQVVARTGGRGTLFPWETGWKDTVLLEDGETVDVLVRFDRYRGIYLMHCHKLEHEDMGMMTNFQVV